MHGREARDPHAGHAAGRRSDTDAAGDRRMRSDTLDFRSIIRTLGRCGMLMEVQSKSLR